MTPFDLEPRDIRVAAFYLDRHEVTHGEYRQFVEATGARAPWPEERIPEGEEHLPVVRISWREANAYAEWAGKRLPTQLEWEAAARGPEGLAYPWGNDYVPERTILGRRAGTILTPENTPRAVPVESLTEDVSVFGVLGMAGNVREWVFDPWLPRPEVKPEETWQLGIGHRTVRGSSWAMPESAISVRSSYRWSAPEGDRPRDVGFRCAKSKRP
jgi:formylglycine-generating enzyme required for sulfatase activity